MFSTLFRNRNHKSQNVVGRSPRSASRSTRLEVEALEGRSAPSTLQMLLVVASVARGATCHLPVSTPVHTREIAPGGAQNAALRGGSATKVAGGVKGESASAGGSIIAYISRSSGEEIPQQ